jgi:Helicase conserved C-terminal domain
MEEMKQGISETGEGGVREEDKGRLIDHILGRVLDGISGRDSRDLVGIDPKRSIFSGVLYPPRDLHTSQAPAGTALGVDFRVRPNDANQVIQVTVRPRWSHYFAVFPSYESVYEENASGSVAPNIDPREDGDDTGIQQENKPTSIVLPVVWRRMNAQCHSVVTPVLFGTSGSASVGRAVLNNAVQNASRAIADDPDRWRHIGPAGHQERGLKDEPGALRSPETYASALASKAHVAVELPAWSVDLQVEYEPDMTDTSCQRIRVLLANTSPDVDWTKGDPRLLEPCLFDAGLEIEVEGAVVVPFDFLLAPHDYRHKPAMVAKGVNCSVSARPCDNGQCSLSTETLPVFRQPLYRTRAELDVPFNALRTDTCIATLDKLANEMREHIAGWNEFLETTAQTTLSAEEQASCREDRDHFSLEIEQFCLGREALLQDERLKTAFQLMNYTFERLSKRSGGRIRAWRLFQIGFIVSQLPALAYREISENDTSDYAERLRTTAQEVGVLWFPTGGGKTEAYLGLIATALLFDRLRGKLRGICTWMRFPLRMLSLQQLERLAKVVAELNVVRAETAELGVGDPFAMGYYAGQANTPNRISEIDMQRYEQNAGMRDKVLLLRRCPFCEERVEISPRRSDWRLSHVCTNTECFSNVSASLGAYTGSLPVCIVDQEIYRYLPSVLVGTVDKLAIAGYSKYFVHLVNGAVQRCPNHGYTSYNECIEHWNGCQAKKRDLEVISRMKDPGPSLLVQDELHLLREELGVFDAHYEGLLNYLGEQAYRPAKVLAATATIEAYDTQAFQLYLRHARRFPQPSWELGESFYATSQPATERRLYVGLLAHTRAVEDPSLRLLGLYHAEVRRLLKAPREAAVIMERADLSNVEVISTLHLYDLSLCYVGRKAVGGSILDKLGRAEKLLATEDLGSLNAEFLTGENTTEQVGSALERIEREQAETGEARLDVLIATNLISHGVDLERINMMAMCGMPSHYAEYVQATSRAARAHPGIVFTCFKGRDPRETSQYEFFSAMHENLDRLIEAVAINRFATLAPDKTVPGLLAALLLSHFSPRLFGSAIGKPLDYIPTLQIALGMKPGNSTTQASSISKDDFFTALQTIIGVDRVRAPASSAQVLNAREQVEEALSNQMGAIARSQDDRLYDAIQILTSFRDVDEGIPFGSLDSASIVSRLGSR